MSIRIGRESFTEQSRAARDEMHRLGFRSYVINPEHPRCGEEVRLTFRPVGEGLVEVSCVVDDPHETFIVREQELER